MLGSLMGLFFGVVVVLVVVAGINVLLAVLADDDDRAADKAKYLATARKLGWVIAGLFILSMTMCGYTPPRS